jgi:hypothetical protein
MAKSQMVRYLVQKRPFDFQIYNKAEQLGAVAVQHLWMKISGLYDTTPERAGNSIELVECYWALCLEAQCQGEPEHPDDRRTYLLARLLPHTLSNLAATVMPDRGFGPKFRFLSAKAENEALEQLEGMLREPASDLPDIVTFRDWTYDYLGMPKLSEAAKSLYRKEIDLLLDDAAQLMARDKEAAIRLTIDRWKDAKRRLYPRRRWKSPEAKLVMSVISYECRAALNECYSDVWTGLLCSDGPLRERYNLTPADVCFMALWHVIQKAPSDLPNARFDLFHGHIFALHPALGMLIRTPTGKELLGDLVSATLALPTLPEPQEMFARVRELPAFRHLLLAVEMAVCAYTERREEIALERTGPRPISHEEIRIHEERREERRRGKFRGK